jgi:hypothetical protein
MSLSKLSLYTESPYYKNSEAFYSGLFINRHLIINVIYPHMVVLVSKMGFS